MAASSGAGRSLLKARNTAYIKNSLGSIFIRISPLLRGIHTSPYRGLLLTPMLCLQQSLLFSHRLQDLPPLGDPWDKGLTSFRFERGFAQGIVVLHRHEGAGDLPGQRTVGVTVGGKATMAVAGAGPKDAHALRRHQAGRAQAFQGGAGDRSGVILAGHDAVHHITLTVRVGGRAFLTKGREGQVLTGLDPRLLQEVVGQQPRLDRAARPESAALALQVFHRANGGMRLRDELGHQVHIDIPHRHHLTGIVKAPFDFDVGQRTVPGQIHFPADKRLDQGIPTGIQDPVQLESVLLKMFFDGRKRHQVGSRCHTTKPYHGDLLRTMLPSAIPGSVLKVETTASLRDLPAVKTQDWGLLRAAALPMWNTTCPSMTCVALSSPGPLRMASTPAPAPR